MNTIKLNPFSPTVPMESLPERRCAAGADSGDSCARRTCRAESGTFAARALHALCVCVYVIFVPESTVYLCNVWCAGGLFVMWLDGGDEWVRYEKNESLKKWIRLK